jgi:hypothetical protein
MTIVRAFRLSENSGPLYFNVMFDYFIMSNTNTEPDEKYENVLVILIRVHPSAKFSIKDAMKLAGYDGDELKSRQLSRNSVVVWTGANRKLMVHHY